MTVRLSKYHRIQGGPHATGIGLGLYAEDEELTLVFVTSWSCMDARFRALFNDGSKNT